MKVLGIHSLGHDTGVCWFEGPRLRFAIETERLTRTKHDHRVDVALDHLTGRTGFDPGAVDLVAVSTNLSNRLLRIPDLDRATRAIEGGALHWPTRCELLGTKTDCLIVAHEASHAALAAHYAGNEDGTLILVNEGRGSFSRSSLFRWAGGRLELCRIDPLPWYGNGFGWSAMADLLGFEKSPSAAGKVMALGAYGSPSAELRELLLEVDGRIQEDLALRARVAEKLARQSGIGGGFERRADLVATFQELFTAAVARLARAAMAELGCHRLALGGGCALNLPTNDLLRRELDPRLAVAPACNDAGQALGAAVYALRLTGGVEPQPFSVYSNGAAPGAGAARAALTAAGLEPLDYSDELVADRLSRGGIVARLHGTPAIGPRALGNRSLLASPAVAGMRRRLSEELKEREWFRPLGAVMTAESFNRSFPGEPPSPHMLFTYRSGDPSLGEATHHDGSTRLQTLERRDNPGLHRLLRAFELRSGVPALINTSLNRRGRAIAYSADDALDDFLGRDVDLFVLGDAMALHPATSRSAATE